MVVLANSRVRVCGRFSIQPPSQHAVYFYLPIRDLSPLRVALSVSSTVSLPPLVFLGLPGQFSSIANLHFPRCARVLVRVPPLKLLSRPEGVCLVRCGTPSVIRSGVKLLFCQCDCTFTVLCRSCYSIVALVLFLDRVVRMSDAINFVSQTC